MNTLILFIGMLSTNVESILFMDFSGLDLTISTDILMLIDRRIRISI